MLTKEDIVKSKKILSDAGFTRCQIDVLSCLVEGKSNREIGNDLFVTEKAVKYHVTNLMKKLSVVRRWQISDQVVKIVRG